MSRRYALVAITLAIAAIAALLFVSRRNAETTREFDGALPDGAFYRIEVPRNWNGTLAIWSHGYVPPGFPNRASDSSDPATHDVLLQQGYALAGSSYSATGYAVEQALRDQIALLDLVPRVTGLSPRRTIAWGQSLGGQITAGLIQRNPHQFDGALPMCGVLAGSVAAWNSALDFEYAFKTLLAPNSSIDLVHVKNGTLNVIAAEQLLAHAQDSAEGRARIALVAAMIDTPGWADSRDPEPAASDFQLREANQDRWAASLSIPFYFGWRSELESRMRGNGSWNTGVDYRRLFDASVDRVEVEALYRRAGLSLQADLDSLDRGVRVAADPAAVAYLRENIEFNGQIHVPVLTLHTVADGLVGASHEAAYRRVVRAAGNDRLLRQLFVHRAGHCAFGSSEVVAAFEALARRVNDGKWPDLSPRAMNEQAGRINSAWAAPAFVRFSPPPFPRR